MSPLSASSLHSGDYVLCFPFVAEYNMFVVFSGKLQNIFPSNFFVSLFYTCGQCNQRALSQPGASDRFYLALDDGAES